MVEIVCYIFCDDDADSISLYEDEAYWMSQLAS